MISIREAIVVEGRYDKNKLEQIFDAIIIEVSGFCIFNDKEKLSLLRKIADTRGLIVLTDSDSAGFLIRGYLKGAIGGNVKHAYIPDMPGRERRKTRDSREGLLGVEGMERQTLVTALRNCGATMGETNAKGGGAYRGIITKADLYEAGLSGGEESARLRKELLIKLGLPQKLGANAMLDVLNVLIERSDFLKMANDITNRLITDPGSGSGNNPQE